MKIYRNGIQRLILVLILISLSVSAFPVDFKTYRRQALLKRDVARQRIVSLPQEEKQAVLRDFLKAPQKNLRLMAALLTKSEYETALIPDLEKAKEKEKVKGVLKVLNGAIERLRAYQKIELAPEEVAALIRSGNESTNGNNGVTSKGVRPANVTLNVRNWRGDGIPRARVFAYSRKYNIRFPAKAGSFVQTNSEGLTLLPLTAGKWMVVAFSQPAYQRHHKGRAVFLIQQITVKKLKQRIAIRPDAEIRLSFNDEQDTVKIYAADPAMTHETRFPPLGNSAKGRLTIETTKGAELTLFGTGTKPGKFWTFFRDKVAAPASLTVEPQGTWITFSEPKLLPRVKSATVFVSRYAHRASPLSFTVKPGDRLLLAPGSTEIDYAVDADLGRLVYGPRQYELKAGETLALRLDSPTEAEVTHDFFRNYGGKPNVLAACIIARDANGHLLTALQDRNRRMKSFTYKTYHGNRLIAETQTQRGSFTTIVGENIDRSIMPELSYEITADLGPGVPKKMKASEYTKVETNHFSLYGPSLAIEQLKALGQSTEQVFEAIQALRGSPPPWTHKDVLIKVTLPPTVGASAGGRGIRVRLTSVLKRHWIAYDSLKAFPHEMLHLFKFGHDDFMEVWQNATWNLMARNRGSKTYYLPNLKSQQEITAVLRGLPGNHSTAVCWLIYARYGLAPFRFYQDVEKQWKPALQRLQITDDETCCAIFNKATGQNIKPLFEMAGSVIRDRMLAQAESILTGLDSDNKPSSIMTTGKNPLSPETRRLNRVLSSAGRADPERALTNLKRAQPLVDKIGVNRDRVRFQMRFALVYYKLHAEEEMYESLRRAQRAALMVNFAYFKLVRNLATSVVMGQPVVMGHL